MLWACQLCFLLPGREPLPPTYSPSEALWGPPLGMERSQQNLLWPYPHPMVSFRWWQPSESRSWRELLLETWCHRRVISGGRTNVPSESRSVVSNSLWPHGLYSPWNSPGQNTGVGSLSLLQGIFPTRESNPGLPRCRWILYQLSHQGKPNVPKVLLLCRPLLSLGAHRAQFSTCFMGDQHCRKIIPTQKLWVNK